MKRGPSNTNDASDDAYTPESERTNSRTKKSKTDRGRPFSKKAVHTKPQKSNKKPRIQYNKQYYIDRCKILEARLQQEMNAHNCAQERFRSQTYPYFIDDGTMREECELFSTLIANFAADWAAVGSLKDDLGDECIREVLKCAAKAGVSHCNVDSQSWANLTQCERSTRLVTESVLAHHIHAEVLMKPFLFLQDEARDAEGMGQNCTLQKTFECAATTVQDNSTFAANVWQARTLQAFYSPQQISTPITSPVEDDQYAAHRAAYTEALQRELLSSGFESLLTPVDDYAFRNREDQLTDLFQAGYKLALKMHTQDVVIRSWLDDFKPVYRVGADHDTMTLHAITKVEKNGSSRVSWPIDMVVQPAIQVLPQTRKGGEHAVKTWSRAVVAVLSSGGDGEVQESKLQTGLDKEGRERDVKDDSKEELRGSDSAIEGSTNTVAEDRTNPADEQNTQNDPNVPVSPSDLTALAATEPSTTLATSKKIETEPSARTKINSDSDHNTDTNTDPSEPKDQIDPNLDATNHLGSQGQQAALTDRTDPADPTDSTISANDENGTGTTHEGNPMQNGTE